MANSNVKSRVSVSKGRKSSGKTTVRVSSSVQVNTRSSRRRRPAIKRTKAITNRRRSTPKRSQSKSKKSRAKRLAPKSIRYIPVIIASSAMKKRRRVKKSVTRATAAPNNPGVVVMRSVYLVRSSLETGSKPKVSTASMGKLMSAPATAMTNAVQTKIVPMTAFKSNPPMSAAATGMASVVPPKTAPTTAVKSKPALPAVSPVMPNVVPAKVAPTTAVKSKPALPAAAPVMPGVAPAKTAPMTALKNKLPIIAAPQSACTAACKAPSKNTAWSRLSEQLIVSHVRIINLFG